MLTCANGETILITLDTTVPRAFYSRGFSVRATKGMSDEDTRTVFLEGMKEDTKNNEEEGEEADRGEQAPAQLLPGSAGQKSEAPCVCTQQSLPRGLRFWGGSKREEKKKNHHCIN